MSTPNKTDPEYFRTNSENADFHQMVRELDVDLYKRNGDTQAQYEQYNQIDKIRHCMVIYVDGKPVGCGCFKRHDNETIELKRMFVKSELRGKQLAARLLHELEKWAQEEGFVNAVLETGVRQVEAQRLYSVAGYVRTENYGQYIGMPDSICYKKSLK